MIWAASSPVLFILQALYSFPTLLYSFFESSLHKSFDPCIYSFFNLVICIFIEPRNLRDYEVDTITIAVLQEVQGVDAESTKIAMMREKSKQIFLADRKAPLKKWSRRVMR